MNFRKGIAVSSVVCLLSGSVQAATPTSVTDAINQITNDSNLISGWTSDQFKRAIPFNSTAGDVVPSQLKIFGVEAGVEGVVSGTKVDIDGFHALPTSVVNTDQIKMYSRLPVPMVLGHAKIGLPFGFDAGVRIGGFPTESFNNGTTHIDVSNSVFGLDLRKKLIEEGALHPFGLTLDGNFTRAKGHIDESTPYTANTGSQVTLTNTTGAGRTDWDTKSVGVQLIANKQILIINPYIGVAANKNFGSVNTSITNSGTATFNGVSQNFTTMGSGAATPNAWDLRGLIGVEFSILPFVKLDIGGEYASQNELAGSLGLRVQFR